LFIKNENPVNNTVMSDTNMKQNENFEESAQIYFPYNNHPVTRSTQGKHFLRAL